MCARINVQSRQLSADKTHVVSPQVAVNIPVSQSKNTESAVAFGWEYAEFHVADPVAGSVMTLCLDNGRDYDRISSVPDKIKHKD